MFESVETWLGNWNIGRRLALGFAVVLVLTALYGVFSVQRMALMSDLLARTYRHPLTVGNSVRDVQIGILRIHRTMKDLVLSPPEELLGLAALVDEEESLILAHFDTIEERFLGDAERVRAARRAFLDWKEIRSRVIRLKLEGQDQQAARLTMREGASRVDQLEEKMSALRSFALAKATEFRRDAASTFRQARLITAGLLLATLLAGAAVAWAITRSVRRPVAELSRASRAISEGDLSERAAVSSRDELGRLAETFNRMVANIEEQTETIRRQHRENERLLLAILPRPIARRLKAGEGTIADAFSNVSVLFADLVGFTPLSSRLNPEELVQLLDRLFSRFDELVEEMGVEKIKTIGDAYMACCGLPRPRDDHADVMTRLGVRMLAAVRDFNREAGTALDLRIGVATGPAVAGVIGRSKFIYDLWGDTVNTASRMESHGVPGCVQITRETYSALSDRAGFESRGIIRVKGKGEMEVFVARGSQAA